MVWLLVRLWLVFDVLVFGDFAIGVVQVLVTWVAPNARRFAVRVAFPGVSGLFGCCVVCFTWWVMFVFGFDFDAVRFV